MLFYKKRYIIAVYDLRGEMLEDVIVTRAERENFLRQIGISIKSEDFFYKFVKRHEQEFPFIRFEKIGKVFYFVDVFEQHDDVFKECDEDFLKVCLQNDLKERERKYKMTEKDKEKIMKRYNIPKTALNGRNLDEKLSVDKILDNTPKSR